MKEITYEDVERNPELYIKYLEQQTNKMIRNGIENLNIYTGISPADPRCPECGQSRVFNGGKYKCTVCDRH